MPTFHNFKWRDVAFSLCAQPAARHLAPAILTPAGVVSDVVFTCGVAVALRKASLPEHCTHFEVHVVMWALLVEVGMWGVIQSVQLRVYCH